MPKQKRKLALALTVPLLASCTVVATTAVSTPRPPTPSPSPPKWFETLQARWTSSPDVFIPLATTTLPSETNTPRPSQTRTPYRLPLAPSGADPTLWSIMSTFAVPCDSPPLDWETSPNQLWQTVLCLWYDDPSRYRLLILPRGSSTPIGVFDSHVFGSDGASPFVWHWSRDGKYAYIAADAYGQGYVPPHDTIALLRLSLDDRAVATILAPAIDTFYEIAFSPDDQLLAYAKFGQGTPSLTILGGPNKSLTLPLDSAYSRAGDIEWWRDSQTLAFVLSSDELSLDGEYVSTRATIELLDLPEIRLQQVLSPIDRPLWIDAWISASALRIGIVRSDQEWDDIAILDLTSQTLGPSVTETPDE